MRVDRVEAGSSTAVRGSASTGAAASSGAPLQQPKHAPNALDLEIHNLLILDHHTFEGTSTLLVSSKI